MKLVRFITKKEAAELRRFSLDVQLQNDNKHTYYYAERIIDNPKVVYIKKLLSEVIEDFVSFTNFLKSNPEEIRIQYQYSKELSFHGVGFITIDELENGFKEESEV